MIILRVGRSHNNLLPIRIKAMIEAPVITSKGELVSGACVTHATSDLCLTERERGGGGGGKALFCGMRLSPSPKLRKKVSVTDL